MSVGPLQLLLIILIIVLLFGTKKLGNIGSDLGKAIRDFKKGMSGGDDDEKNKNAENSEKLKPDEPAAKSEKPDASDSGNQKSSHDSSGR